MEMPFCNDIQNMLEQKNLKETKLLFFKVLVWLGQFLSEKKN